MKHYASISGLAALLFAVFSCGSPDREKVSGFGDPEKIECDSIAIEQILAPIGWGINGDKVVILSRNTDNQFFVYRTPDFEYLYSFGREGNGPDDFLYPRFIPDVSGKGQLLVPGLRKMSWVDLGDDKAVVSRSEKYEGYESPYLMVSDSIVMALGITSSTEILDIFYRTTNTKTKQALDSTQLLVHTKDLIARTGRFNNFPYPAAKAGRMAVIYGDVPRIDIFTVSPGGKLTLEQSKGEILTLEQINALDISKRPNGVGVSSAQGSDKYIYVFTYDYESPKPPARKRINSYMEVYDWDGNPVKKFDLGRPFTQLLVDDAQGKIYGYNNSSDFENVYVYDYML